MTVFPLTEVMRLNFFSHTPAPNYILPLAISHSKNHGNRCCRFLYIAAKQGFFHFIFILHKQSVYIPMTAELLKSLCMPEL